MKRDVQWRIVFLISLLFGVPSWSPASSMDQPAKLSASDTQAIRATIEAYRKAWLENDNTGVLRTFTDDAILMPAHGSPAVVGIAAIENYWFAPGGPPTTITVLDITVDEVSGNSSLAYARGLDTVAWTIIQDGTKRHLSHPGTYLNVMKRMPDGSWRIQVHMWDDGPERVE